MTLVKKSNMPSLWNEKWLSDFFDTKRFFDSDLLKYDFLPATNITEKEKEFLIELAVPGMAKKDFKIEVENGILTISAEKEEEKEEKDKNYTRREFNYAGFSRSFTLPENSNADKIEANYENGLLKLHVAKKVVNKVPLRKEIAVV